MPAPCGNGREEVKWPGRGPGLTARTKDSFGEVAHALTLVPKWTRLRCEGHPSIVLALIFGRIDDQCRSSARIALAVCRVDERDGRIICAVMESTDIHQREGHNHRG